jgi:NAD(P)-dependent dehydrogenase (short-subunit alcohol dehydrogenase family)
VAVLFTVPQAARGAPASEATRQAWRAEIARSATPVVIPVLVAGRRMLMRGEGRIVNVIDSSHDGHGAGAALFAAAQGAVLALTRALAIEWQPRGVVVRALVPDASEDRSGPHAHATFRNALREALLDGNAPAIEPSTRGNAF